eukprot:10832103-Heterocapsa_arctica.AAC.1
MAIQPQVLPLRRPGGGPLRAIPGGRPPHSDQPPPRRHPPQRMGASGRCRSAHRLLEEAPHQHRGQGRHHGSHQEVP